MRNLECISEQMAQMGNKATMIHYLCRYYINLSQDSAEILKKTLIKNFLNQTLNNTLKGKERDEGTNKIEKIFKKYNISFKEISSENDLKEYAIKIDKNFQTMVKKVVSNLNRKQNCKKCIHRIGYKISGRCQETFQEDLILKNENK